jgi:TetR/AcrR family transcriptional regulator, repressor for neighboring sulfatase
MGPRKNPKTPKTSKASKRAPSRRRRFPAEQARARILDAAERKLADVGPEALRLTDLAAELEISHQAILHHFGSREELVSAVLGQAIARINQRLADAMTTRTTLGANGMLDIVADYYGAEGRARLLAWLMLSERGQQLQAQAQAARPLQPLLELVHALRKKVAPGRRIEHADTRFLCELAAFALLGEALFGGLVRVAFGHADDSAASRDFRNRFARLLKEER